jgi:hypothetical protein
MLSAYPVPLVGRLVSNSPRLKERLASETMVADQRQGRRNAGEPASADLRQLTGGVSVAQGEGVAAKIDDGVKDHRPRGTVSRGAPTLASSGPFRQTDSCARRSCPGCPDNLPLRAPWPKPSRRAQQPGPEYVGVVLTVTERDGHGIRAEGLRVVLRQPRLLRHLGVVGRVIPQGARG